MGHFLLLNRKIKTLYLSNIKIVEMKKKTPGKKSICCITEKIHESKENMDFVRYKVI